jgi:molecular chaperone GrpE
VSNKHRGRRIHPVDEDELSGADELHGAEETEDMGQATAADGAREAAADPLARLAEVESELAGARQEAEENRERWLRTAADLENVRRRAARDLETSTERGRADVLLDLLAVLDDVDRALAAIAAHPGGGKTGPAEEGADETGDPVVTGVRIIRTRLIDTLRRHGVRESEALGQPFDPHVHEAVMQVPAGDVPDGFVAQVLERGYWLGERVLRPAKVAVARAFERS